MRFEILLSILILISCCKKKENYDTVKIIGHAGNGLNISNSMYHDNSLNSIELALSQNGCDGVEIDVQLSKSGTAWLFHDENLKTEANLDACINSSTDEELSKLNYNHFNDEKLLKLNELKIDSKTIFLDLRHSNSCTNQLVDFDKFTTEINLFKSNNPSCEIYVITNYLTWVKSLKDKHFNVCFAPSNKNNLDQLIIDYEIEMLIFKNKDISKQEVEVLKTKVKKIVIFEVRSPKGIRSALNKFPDYLMSDDVKAAIVEKY
jgi:glycerophosphoryl diester phosphodiesterase